MDQETGLGNTGVDVVGNYVADLVLGDDCEAIEGYYQVASVCNQVVSVAVAHLCRSLDGLLKRSSEHWGRSIPLRRV